VSSSSATDTPAASALITQNGAPTQTAGVYSSAASGCGTPT
jgi:hypothetical protein